MCPSDDRFSCPFWFFFIRETNHNNNNNDNDNDNDNKMATEAHPQKFNSRLRNKMYYSQVGSRGLLQRKWKDLSEFVTIECDGKDITPKLRAEKVNNNNQRPCPCLLPISPIKIRVLV